MRCIFLNGFRHNFYAADVYTGFLADGDGDAGRIFIGVDALVLIVHLYIGGCIFVRRCGHYGRRYCKNTDYL